MNQLERDLFITFVKAMALASLLVAIVIGLAALAGCETWQQRNEVVSAVRTIEAPPTVIAAPCVDADQIPEPFESRMPLAGDIDVHNRAGGADADLSWLKPRYAKARGLLIECSQLPKEPSK